MPKRKLGLERGRERVKSRRWNAHEKEPQVFIIHLTLLVLSLQERLVSRAHSTQGEKRNVTQF